ncbi:Carbonyl reductase [NADPH] 3 [Toxocara canis]|uniref:carbonyl reductase (NADPH) n=1 Tax=Toxocara canis TaxID=6265 RepID=A0A0B2VUM0_TOXCA|nr:Carbonyl reductase [NADPH] 3 [Toxocara canis]
MSTPQQDHAMDIEGIPNGNTFVDFEKQFITVQRTTAWRGCECGIIFKSTSVTGANKGIGYGIVKGLAEKVSGGIVYLTARNETLGKQSLGKVISELGEKRNSEIRYHQLDITDRNSIQTFAEYLKKEHGGFDVLVNNAGFAFKNAATEPPEEQARVTIGVNYEGTKQTCDILFPLLRDNGRVVNVCSQAGLLAGRYSDDIIAKLTSPTLTVAEIDKFANDYIQACIDKNTREKGYFYISAYCTSKAALIALTMVQSRALRSRNIVVNGCCPGYVDTDMTSHKGPLTIEEGADTPIYLATLEGNEPNGCFIYRRKPLDWTAAKLSM